MTSEATRVQFSLPYQTQFGQVIKVVGSVPELGLWNLDSAPYMNYEHGTHSLTVPLVLSGVQYKYVLVDEVHGAVFWETGPNRSMALKGHVEGLVQVSDLWRNDSGLDSLYSTKLFHDVVFRRKNPRKVHALRHTAEPSAVLVRFQCEASHVPPGYEVVVVGNLPQLGHWKPEQGIPMKDGSFPLWKTNIVVYARQFPVEYKFVIRPTAEPKEAPATSPGSNGPVHATATGSNQDVSTEPITESIARLSVDAVTEPQDPVWEQGSNWHISTPPASTVILVKNTGLFRMPPGHHFRGAGCAIPVFSIRSGESCGIGEFADLKPLVNWCASVGFSVLQLLPVNDTTVYKDWRDSYPYRSNSVFALHPLFIRIDDIPHALPAADAKAYALAKDKLNAEPAVNYDGVYNAKEAAFTALWKAHGAALEKDEGLKTFVKDNWHWLGAYCMFRVFMDEHGTATWSEWPVEHRENVNDAKIRAWADVKSKFHNSFMRYAWIQFVADQQLRAASEHAAAHGVGLKGDLPIGVSRDSADAWSRPDQFHLDLCAGAPPDAFADDGQNWGFPTYNWETMAKDGYSWWSQRLSVMAKYFHAFRIDHILGFFRIWAIPAGHTSGLLGRFDPCHGVGKSEVESLGWWDMDRLTTPYIRVWHVESLPHTSADWARRVILHDQGGGVFTYKEPYAHSQIAILQAAKADGIPEEDAKKMAAWMTNVVMLKDQGSDGSVMYPRIEAFKTESWRSLPEWLQGKLYSLYVEFFYRRQEELWRETAMKRLPVMKASSDMLVCGEDLGMVPDCVGPVMDELSIMGLRIQRMPADPKQEFGLTWEYPPMTVCTPSVHDTSTIRGWWEEDRGMSAWFYRTVLGEWGEAPYFAEPAVVRAIVRQHLEAASMWAIFPIQDLFAMDASLVRPGHPDDERINVPANPNHYWRYRMHLSVTELATRTDFGSSIAALLAHTGRRL